MNKSFSVKLYDIYQYIIIGHEMIGKTSIINRYFDGVFLNDLSRTFAIDFRSKHINLDKDTEVIIRAWDTAGQERYDSISKNYYNKGDCIFLCFSICDRKSFTKLDYYMEKINQYSNKDSIVVLVGTFYDKETERTISQTEIKAYQSEHNLEYFEVSSKTGVGVRELFNRTIQLIYDKRQKTHIMQNKVYSKILQSTDFEQNKKNCCF